MKRNKRTLEKTEHTWVNGPDGDGYHCIVCGISKCEDHGNYNTCESWIIERGKRVAAGMWSVAYLKKEWQGWQTRKGKEVSWEEVLAFMSNHKIKSLKNLKI